MSSHFLSPRHRAVDGNGKPISGAKLYVYNAGTTTPVTTYLNQALTVERSNPVVADSNGLFPAVFLHPANYKYAIYDSNDVLVWTQDFVPTPLSSSGGDIAVEDGGTGSSSAAGARTNLGAASSADVTALSSAVASVQGQVDSVEVGGTLRALAGKSEVEFDDLALGMAPVLQFVTAKAQTTVTMPITDGTQYLSAVITPKRATSTIAVMCSGGADTGSNGQDATVGLFRSGLGTSIVASEFRPNDVGTFSLIGSFAPTTTDAVTLSIRSDRTLNDVSLIAFEVEATS